MSEHASSATTATLSAELEQLNTELRELGSTDLSFRAYVLTWVTFVMTAVTLKLVIDWIRTESRPPVLAVGTLLVAGWAVVDGARTRARRRVLAANEDRKLIRQRELRARLGLDQAPPELFGASSLPADRTP